MSNPRQPQHLLQDADALPGAYDHAGDLEHCPKSDDGSHCRCWWDDEGPCCRCGDDTNAGESDDSPREAAKPEVSR